MFENSLNSGNSKKRAGRARFFFISLNPQVKLKMPRIYVLEKFFGHSSFYLFSPSTD
jgi:hypothetical protein